MIPLFAQIDFHITLHTHTHKFYLLTIKPLCFKAADHHLLIIISMIIVARCSVRMDKHTSAADRKRERDRERD